MVQLAFYLAGVEIEKVFESATNLILWKKARENLDEGFGKLLST